MLINFESRGTSPFIFKYKTCLFVNLIVDVCNFNDTVSVKIFAPKINLNLKLEPEIIYTVDCVKYDLYICILEFDMTQRIIPVKN